MYSEVETDESAIFKRGNLSDFEKLLFAQKEIADLKAQLESKDKIISEKSLEIGYLKSEIDELKYEFKKEKPENAKLAKYKSTIKDAQKSAAKYKKMYEEIFHKMVLTSNENFNLKKQTKGN